MTAPVVAAEVLALQRAASDPEVSAWVAANAGSGKTYVLAQRVIRHLLDGNAPNRILCLTFTKAAAANMATRVFDTLRRWTALDDAALDAEIAKIEGRRPDPVRRRRARRLFAEALETPGGLKVQTIHAFCARLLQQFPFEAEVPARFTVLEERAEAELIDRLRLDVLLEAAAAGGGPLAEALAAAIAAVADQTFAEAVREAIAQRDTVAAWLERAGGVAGAMAELSELLGIDAQDNESALCRDCAQGAIAVAEWPRLADLFDRGKRFDQYQAARWRRAAANGWPAAIDDYLTLFLTEDGNPRSDTSLMGKDLRQAEPALWARLDAERDRVAPFWRRLRAVRARARTAALLTIAGEVIARYRAEKERRGLLDYDDLIDKARALFARVSASWVLYKLDLGINHVLIDEAQDTSPNQWEIIRHLVSEFTAGEGARGSLKRSIFAVGDEKQSIFSFQGASPRHFADMGRYFRRAHADIGRPFREVRFNHSFRSAPAVLEAVDTVFGRPEAYAGLTADPVRTVHQAVREHAPGMVEIWELIRPEPREEIEGWDVPSDTVSETSPAVRLARKIARAVRHTLASGVRPGDILVLVRQRGALFEAIIRALKDADVEVAGADRLMLTEHIAVMDLMVLADYLLLPADDLALATVLRSPLFGLDEEQLFALAWQRTGTLHEALEAKARSDSRYAAAREALHRMAAAARQQTPFAFFARVLGAERGRARMLARFGPEAADALDEFLNLALAYESSETPSLRGFIAWLRAAPTEIKRDMELARDEVRVMTVHGAKGLEAPVVILADTTTSPRGPRDPYLLTLTRPGAGDALVWAAAPATDVEAMALARAESRRAAEDEYRRLLYVAVTRAADRLIVCGAEGARKRPQGCWYDLVFDALVGDRPGEAAPDGIGRIWHFRKGEEAAVAPSLPSVETAARIDLPEWLQNDAAAETAATIRISPARALEEATLSATVPAAATGASRERAQVRGILLHRLIQSLPELPRDRRAEAAARYVARAGGDFAAVERDRFVAEVLAVLDHPGFRPLAAPDSRAEVPIVGRLSRPGGMPISVSGQIDRLAVTADTVWIADYKTNRPAPRRLDKVPAAYLAQLALYRALIAKLYPGRSVRTVLVWTDVPDFMEIPASLLDQALAAVTAA